MSVRREAELVYFSSKGQVVIPRRLRKEFEIEEGTKAAVVATPEGILIKLVTPQIYAQPAWFFEGHEGEGNG